MGCGSANSHPILDSPTLFSLLGDGFSQNFQCDLYFTVNFDPFLSGVESECAFELVQSPFHAGVSQDTNARRQKSSNSSKISKFAVVSEPVFKTRLNLNRCSGWLQQC